VTTSRPHYSQPSALALRFHAILAAHDIGLLPQALARAVLRLASAAEDRVSLLLRAGEVQTRFLDHRQKLGLGDVAWPQASNRSTIWAARSALSWAQRQTNPRSAAERLGRFCEHLSNRRRDRRQSGRYYTPGWAADAIARTLVQTLLRGRGQPSDAVVSIRALDPAVGAGAFAVAVVDAMADAAGEGEEENAFRRIAAKECVWGIDKDPLAVEACTLAVWLAASRPRRLASVPSEHVLVGDALAKPKEHGTFDIVLGNPPWGVKLPQRYAKQLGEGASRALAGHRESALFFIALAVRMTANGGAIGMLLPDAVLWHVRYQGLRELLLDRFSPVKLLLLGDRIFPGVSAPSCGLCLVGEHISSKRFPIVDLRAVPRRELPRTLNRQSWSASVRDIINAPQRSLLVPPSWLRKLRDRILADHRTLGELECRFAFCDVGINYPTASLGRSILYAGFPEDERDIPVVRGRDFGPLTAIGHSAWLRHDWHERVGDASGVSIRESVYRAWPKLLLRQTGDRPVATVDRRGVYFGRSVIAVSAHQESELLWLAALLNSDIFAALYQSVAPEAGRSFAQVKVSKLKLIPVPGIELGQDLIVLAEQLLEEPGEEQRRNFFVRLNAAAADAYGLSDRELKQVGAMITSNIGEKRMQAPRAGTS